MAYIRKRGKSWYYTVDIGRNLVTGEREQESKGGYRTKRDAELAAADVEVQVAEGTFVKQTKISFREFAESWLEFYESTGEVKPGSVQVRRTRINKLYQYFGGAKLVDIKLSHYQNMLIDLKKNGAANETILSIHATARMIFRRAMELRILKINPTEYSKVPRKQKTVAEIESREDIPRYMEKEQLAKFLRTAKIHGKDKDYNLFMVLAYTGLRIGEAVVLQWKDIDLNNKTISITKTYHSVRNNTTSYKLVPPKTEAGIRVIDFDDTLKKIFEKQRLLVNEYKMKYRKKYFDGDFVFPNLGPNFPGYPETQKKPAARMKTIVELAGLSNFTPHSLRHTHITLLAEAGATLIEIMERLGHKDDKTTRLVYMHVTKEMKKGTAQKFSDLMMQVVKK
ncbi:site-specific integrase [Paenibacillus senegalimassiliensis]|uniref:site-specific integrase n=1 Tax=Paenibacillus senegalimassiliensis TaxID=1737426 RepID=UPI00073E5ACA|nr:tyrosine-type recombinase/integrase [Paenibacillus senegalimassiliensis]